MDDQSSRKRGDESPTRRRRRRFFLGLEILTVVLAIGGIGLYGDFLGTLGLITFQMGHPGLAENWLRCTLWAQEKARGPRSVAVVEPLNDLGYFYFMTEQYDKAVPVAERSVAICRANLPPRKCGWTFSIASLAYDGVDNFAEAERLANEALPILEAATGKQSWQVASTLNRLGMALDGEGRLPEAEAALTRALAIREGIGGGNWDGLIPVLNNLSSVYSE